VGSLGILLGIAKRLLVNHEKN
jgi:hypothetical protein